MTYGMIESFFSFYYFLGMTLIEKMISDKEKRDPILMIFEIYNESRNLNLGILSIDPSRNRNID